MELQLINELSESRLFRSIDKYQEYTLKDIAELTYIYVLILELFRTTKHEDFAQKYVKDTIRFNNFHSFKFSANDLYHFSHLLIGDDNGRSLGRLKDTFHKTKIDFIYYRKFLRDIAAGRFDEAFDKRYLLRLERELGIGNSNLKAIRRMVTNWIVQNNVSMMKSAATKLLIELRKRAIKSELRMELEKFGRLDEYKLIKTKFTNVFKNPTREEFLILLGKYKELRGLLKEDNIYIWNAYDANHDTIKREANLPNPVGQITFFSKDAVWKKGKEINGVWFYLDWGSKNIESKFLRRVLGLDKLNEYKMIKVEFKSHDINVYKNPINSEFLTLLKSFKDVRGIVDEAENLYVWNARLAVHDEMKAKLMLDVGVYDHISFDSRDTAVGGVHGLVTWLHSPEEHIKHSKFLRRILTPQLKEYKVIKVEIGRSIDVDIFKNPSHQEFLNILQGASIRGLIDTDENLYVWDAYDAIHYDVEEALGVTGSDELFFELEGEDIRSGSRRPAYPGTVVINGIVVRSRMITYDLEKRGSSLLMKALGVKKKIDEYKLIKINQPFESEIKVFQNPSYQELLSILQSSARNAPSVRQMNDLVRGLIDSKGYLYVWDAYNATHDDIEDSLGLEGKIDYLYFSINDELSNQPGNYEKINKIYVNSEMYGHDVKLQAKPKFLKRALGVKKKIDEYKIIKTDVTNVFKNPMRSEFLILLKKHKELRGLTDYDDNLYVWNAYDSGHWEIMKELNLTANSYGLYFSVEKESSSTWDVKKKEINGIWFGSTFRGIEDNSIHLQRVLGIKKKIDEYKLIKTLQTNIFKNPTKQEFLSLLDKTGEMRGLVDVNQNLYIWNAGDAIHRQIEDDLIDITFYDKVFFSKEFDVWNEWDLENINGIFFSSDQLRNRDGSSERTRKAINNSKFVRRVLGLDKLKEYKMIKVNSINHINHIPINVFKNPTRQEFLALVGKHALRGLVDEAENLYVWDASKAIHFTMGQELALHVSDSGSGGVFYDTLMFIKDSEWRFSEWTFEEFEGRDGQDVLFASRSQRRKDYGWTNEIRHSVEHSPFVKKALGM